MEDKKVYIGIANPTPPPGDTDTTYFNETRMKEAVDSGAFNGLPLHINHNVEGMDSAGEIISGHLDDDGQLVVAFNLADNPSGELLNTLMQGEHGMGELSLGYDVYIDDKTQKVLGNIATEVSVCYKGDRPNTEIQGSMTVGELIDMARNLPAETTEEDGNDNFYDGLFVA